MLHTWSLSVEEHFYIFLPVFLVVIFRYKPLRNPRWLGSLLLFGGIASLCLSCVSVHKYASSTFYLLPTRAWELICGAWLATLSKDSFPRQRLLREGAAWIGLSGILLPCWLYSKTTVFPGLAALPPCLGSALIIWANFRRDTSESLTTLGRLLTRRPVVALGLISYSLYLWHWPVLVFAKYWWPYHWDWAWPAGFSCLAAASVFAFLSWRFVETPFRKKHLAGTRKTIFRFAGIAAVITLSGAICSIMQNGFPGRFPEIVLKNAAAESDKIDSSKSDLTIEDVRQNRLVNLGVLGSERKVLLWGDSHARHAIPALNALCLETGISGSAVVRSSSPPLLHASFSPAVFTDNPEFADEVLRLINRQRPSHVVLAARWGVYLASPADEERMESSLSDTIQALRARNCTVWVLQDVPDVDTPADKALAQAALFSVNDSSWRRKPDAHRVKNAVIYRAAESNLPARFIDPAPLLLDSSGESYRADIGGVSIYHDDNHLTTHASQALLLPLFRQAMRDSLGDPGRDDKDPGSSTDPDPELKE